jgi:hypothetical protein
MEDQQIPSTSNQLENFFNISFDTATRAQVKQAAVWAKIITMCAFIGYGIALIVAFFGKQVSSEELEGIRVSTIGRASTVISTLITVAIGTAINYFLYRFAVSTAKGMDSMDNMSTNEGFNSLRIYFKILGILLIIGLCFAALAVLIFLASYGLRGR